MTVNFYHLCASMRACVCACVCGGGFFDISTAGVRLKRYIPFIYKPSPKCILFISDTGRSKLRKQVLRSILAPGYSSVGSNG